MFKSNKILTKNLLFFHNFIYKYNVKKKLKKKNDSLSNHIIWTFCLRTNYLLLLFAAGLR